MTLKNTPTNSVWMNDKNGRISRLSILTSLQVTFDRLIFSVSKYTIPEGMIIIHMDFSENYSFQYQDEVQQAHWNAVSCTLYTAILFYRD